MKYLAAIGLFLAPSFLAYLFVAYMALDINWIDQIMVPTTPEYPAAGHRLLYLLVNMMTLGLGLLAAGKYLEDRP